MKLEIEISQAVLEQLAADAAMKSARQQVEDLYNSGRFNLRGEGWDQVARAVRAAVEKIDLSTLVSRAIAERLEPLVRDRVDVVISRAVDAEIRLRMSQKKATLFDAGPSGEAASG